MSEYNPDRARSGSGRGPGATVVDLQAHCDWLNSLNWVRASGKPYFVRRRDDGLHEVAR